MAYGQGDYGQGDFGGSSFQTQGPRLVASSPSNGATGVGSSDSISLTVESDAALDINSLKVVVNGTVAVLAETFQTGFSGTITGPTEYTLVVDILTQPNLPEGSNQVDIFVDDVAGEEGSFSFTFSVPFIETVAEDLSVLEVLAADESFAVTQTVSLEESLGVSAHKEVNLSERVRVEENITVASFVKNLDWDTIQITTPFEFHFDNALDLSNYVISSDLAGPNPGCPVSLKDITLQYTIYQTGSSGAAIPDEVSPGVVDLKDGRTDIFQFSGFITTLFNLGDFIFLRDGLNAGLYQILEVLDPGPSSATVRLDKQMSLLDSNNGVLNTDDIELVDVTEKAGGLATSESRLVFRVNNPDLSPLNPIKSIYALEQRARETVFGAVALNSGTAISAEVEGGYVGHSSFDLSQLVFEDYRTFSIPNTGQPLVWSKTSSPSASVEAYLGIYQVESRVGWTHLSGVQGATFKTTGLLNNGDYLLQAKNLYKKLPRAPYTSPVFKWTVEDVERPRVLDTKIDNEGTVRVLYDRDMRQDAENLTNPLDYSIQGPSTVRVEKVQPLGPREVALFTEGFQAGDYTLTVSSSTPKDLAGNPLSPFFSSTVFTATTPIRNRSVFTDKGPIAKPALSLQTGTAATVDDLQTLTLPGSVLTKDDVGKRLRLTGSVSNDDTYRILSVLGTDKVRVQARLNYPDSSSGVIDWEVFDPRNGMIADDPSDVKVTVNGSPVIPEAVIGLRGQVILAEAPVEDDSVEVDYCYICNPKVEIRRLNSTEFRLNAYNRDVRADTRSQHNYRYNNVLITPSTYEANDIQAPLDTPLLRGLKYRAYERAYTATLNDPNRLLLNTPIHRIAYPPAQRPLSEKAVFYEGTVLPEADASNPWTRRGGGSASAVAGVLTVTDDSSGTAPTGEGAFWTLPIDLSFDHVFSAAWRFTATSVGTYEGVWSGLAAGYSDELRGYVVGFLEEAGVKKVGFLRRGAEDALREASSWTGGVAVGDVPTNAPVAFDWGVLHSYRVSRSQDGTVRLYVDGDVVETLRILPEEAPFLEELNAPFDQAQGVFFGSLSRVATSTSEWDFFRYLAQPISIVQTAPSTFVSYEANDVPELDSSPWTPIGFHGSSTIRGADFLFLESTSASDASQSLIGGGFRGYLKLEPLLTAASQYTIDFSTQLLTHTHSYDPNGLVLAVDDGNRLTQVSFLSDTSSPFLSYGGRTLPEDFSPTPWTSLGSQPSSMRGRYLHVEDADPDDGKVYLAEDDALPLSADRVLLSTLDYIAEARLKVNSYTPDTDGFCGAFAQAYDSSRSLGFLLLESGNTKYVSLHSDGVELGISTRFAFDWGDGNFHTFRIRKSTGGNLVSLFADGDFLGSAAYSDFAAPAIDAVGQLTFGSSTATSSDALSDVEWAYCNAWRIPSSERRFVGIWKGTSNGDLTDYHLPLKTRGTNASVQGNTLGDTEADFVAANVLSGDLLVVDFGANQGVYEISNVTGSGSLTILGSWPSAPTVVSYRVVRQLDWSSQEKYRLFRDTSGNVSLFFSNETSPVLTVGYNPIDLPVSGSGLIKTMSDGLSAIAFGSFSQAELGTSLWDYVRYGITRTATELRMVPPNQVLNQWNVIESPERLFTTIPHNRTDYKSESTGITPNLEPDFLERADVKAFTQLNQGTPLVPLTQSFEVRGPYASQVYLSSLNDPQAVLGGAGFTLNSVSTRVTLVVPDDVLYTSLKVIEVDEGSLDILTPFDDDCGPEYGDIQYQRNVCLKYTGDTLPESDVSASTPWALAAEDTGQVNSSAFGGLLSFGTGGLGTRAAYYNNTPLPDAPSLQTEVKFRLKLDRDATLGMGDSQVRFGLSAPGMTIGLGFVTTALGDRYVQVFDLNNGLVLGYATFDYLDGAFHDYRIVRTPGADIVEIFIDA